MPLAAGDTAAVRAEAGLAAGAASGDLAAVAGDAGVHGAEGGGGEGREHARVDGDGFGDALASGEPGADELVGVGAVGLGAGRADRGAAVSARQVDHLVRVVVGVEGGEDLSGRGVDVADGAAEPDRADASPGRQGGCEPLGVVVAGGAVEKLSVECPGARPGPRAVDQCGGQGQRRGAHAAGFLVLPAGAAPS